MSEVGSELEQFRRGAAIGVDVAAIERALDALWREGADGSGDKSLVRACLWNVVVRTGSDEELERGRKLVDAIAPVVPVRALVLELLPAGEGRELEAWISANCQIAPGGGKLLCSEEITVVARGPGHVHVPPLVSALAVPDVPVALLWMGPPPHDLALVRPLLGGADRFIIDTGDLGSRGDLIEVAKLCEIARSVPLADLGWQRLAPFRVLLASFFDRPVGAEPLGRVRSIRLECSRLGAATSQLLLGWLAARLEWGKARPVANKAGAWTAARPGGEVKLEIEVKDGDAGRDGIFEIAIETDRGERFSITDLGPEVITLKGTGLPDRVVASPERSDPELLVAALGTRGRDPLFRLALERAAELSR